MESYFFLLCDIGIVFDDKYHETVQKHHFLMGAHKIFKNNNNASLEMEVTAITQICIES